MSRPRLAYVSPLAPQQTGISDYSGELLPELARYYDIDVVTNAQEVTDPWVLQNCQVRSAEWFSEHGDAYERVLYHVGNSSYHEHMFALLERHPGAVVLHDFFLGHVLRHMQAHDPGGRAWSRALYESHGYAALKEALSEHGSAEAVWKYPANYRVLAAARGVIVHSQFQQRLAREWYGEHVAQRLALVPLLRVSAPTDAKRRAQAREALGLDDDDFIVCTFGVMGPLKLSERLLDAWMQSGLAPDPHCRLLFVGANDGGHYGETLSSRIREANTDRMRITGWVDTTAYRQYLAAADLAVQLRSRTRGETSAAALDCLNYGVPTIVNAHGSLADLPHDVVHAIPDEFTTQDLVEALETLRTDAGRRKRLADAAARYLREEHAPARCARQYADAIERFYGGKPDFLPRRSPGRQLLVDVSAISRNDLKSGIQRVVRSVLNALIEDPPAGFRIEPVYLSDEGGPWHLRHARRYMLGLLGCPTDALDDGPAQPSAGDVFFGVDLSGGYVVSADRAGLFQDLRAKGVAVTFVVHDLLPLQMPDKFPQHDIPPFRAWLDVVARSDAVLCVSATVAKQFSEWRAKNVHEGPAPFVSHFHHGADIEQSAPTRGNPDNHIDVVSTLESRPSFLMVGTIEPRKGQAQVLAALDILWAEGAQWNLVLIGRQGWMVEALANRIRNHPELGRRLFWLQGVSDEFLQRVYGLASCLVFASEGEGFGIPLIEAAQHGVPIVARDIPVFREVAGDHAFYFSGLSPRALARALEEWRQLHRHGLHPRSDGMKWLTWRESTQQIKQALARAGLLDARDQV
jgi:glycosyltransferase involved in cell wall biosynthesis